MKRIAHKGGGAEMIEMARVKEDGRTINYVNPAFHSEDYVVLLDLTTYDRLMRAACPCARCRGKGKIKIERCGDCNEATFRDYHCPHSKYYCPKCNGNSHNVIEETCPICNGTGIDATEKARLEGE